MLIVQVFKTAEGSSKLNHLGARKGVLLMNVFTCLFSLNLVEERFSGRVGAARGRENHWQVE